MALRARNGQHSSNARRASRKVAASRNRTRDEIGRFASAGRSTKTKRTNSARKAKAGSNRPPALTRAETVRMKRIAEELKGRADIAEPFAVAVAVVKRQRRKGRATK